MSYYPVALATFVFILLRSYTAAEFVEHGGYPQTRPSIPFTLEDDRAIASNYNFGYSVNNKDTGDVKQHEEVRNGNEVRGSYAILDSDGQKRIVQYTAGANGFNAYVQRGNYPSYQFPLQTRQHFYTGIRQGLHTNILDRNRYLNNINNISPQQQYEFDKLLYTLGQRHSGVRFNFDRRNLQNGQNTQNRGTNHIAPGIVPYVKPKFLPSNVNVFNVQKFRQTTLPPTVNENQSQLGIHGCSFQQSANNQPRKQSSKLKQYFDFRNRPISVSEPYHNIDIRRSAPASSYFNSQKA